MSNSCEVEISKCVDLDFSVKIDQIRCNTCGHDSEFTVEVDSCGDIQIYIDQHNCDE